MTELETRVRALSCWTDPTDIAPLTGGITNLNATVVDGGRKYVVRLGRDIPEHGILRWNEIAVARAAAAAGVSPGVVHAEPGAVVFDFVDGEALTEEALHDPATLAMATDLVARVHRDVTPRLRGPVLTFWVFHVCRDYAAFLRENGSPHGPALDRLMAEAARLEEAVGPVRPVLGHNDLLPANFIRDGQAMWLVDWEYGGFNSALFDLGGLASNAGLPPEAEDEMLARYLGHRPDRPFRHSYGAMRCASLLRETMWSMVSEITSELDFDYAAYTAGNLARFDAALAAWKDMS
ncbi:choline/ethanolamine kinase family protein [Marinibacterium sp. SX1]|uniref:choline/ethanolamine kinase family protein n=1 Tax=Marinibacterium sp. SX1 TaxID=3388424 RepID=UPI003D184297